MIHGKKYRESVKKYDKAERFSVEQAVSLVKSMAYAKFDETLDVSVRVSIKKSQTVRDTVVLPHQFRGEKKILVFCKGDKEKEALEAGAAYVGAEELIEKVKGGWLDFDICVATPDMMKDVGKLGPVLGRRGMMPNPKTGTVTFDVKNALAELRKGRTEYRVDKTGVIHLAVGKKSMGDAEILENLKVFLDDLARKKPADAKGDFIKSVSLSTTMSPGVFVTLQKEEA
jgi:large subunit ribosomal protein L1